eukprot:1157515-Pelagomonas_calceolata.AAC.3
MECQSQGGATAARPGPAFQPPSQGAAPCCSSAQPVSLQIIHQQQQQQQQYHPARQDQSASWFGRSWKEQQQYLQQQQHEGGSQPAAGCVLECDDGTEIAEMVVGEELGGQAGQEGGAAEGEKEGEEQSAALFALEGNVQQKGAVEEAGVVEEAGAAGGEREGEEQSAALFAGKVDAQEGWAAEEGASEHGWWGQQGMAGARGCTECVAKAGVPQSVVSKPAHWGESQRQSAGSGAESTGCGVAEMEIDVWDGAGSAPLVAPMGEQCSAVGTLSQPHQPQLLHTSSVGPPLLAPMNERCGAVRSAGQPHQPALLHTSSVRPPLLAQTSGPHGAVRSGGQPHQPALLDASPEGTPVQQSPHALMYKRSSTGGHEQELGSSA